MPLRPSRPSTGSRSRGARPARRGRTTPAALAAVALVAVAAGGGVASPASAALRSPDVVSVEPNDTAVSAWGGWVVWSRRQADGYHLVARRPDGTGVELPAPVADRPFDATVGPGPDGEALVVYSRCTGTSRGARTGCDVWRLDPTSGEQAAVPVASRPGVDEQQPAVWRNRIAFATSAPADAGRRSKVAVAALDAVASATPETLDGPRRETVDGRRRSASVAVVGGVALRGGFVAFSWQTVAERTRWRIMAAASPKANARTQLTVAGTARRVAQLGRPALGGPFVYAPLLRSGAGGRSSIVRVRRTGPQRPATLSSGFTAAQTQRYGSGVTAIGYADPGLLVALRRLASDGRGGCKVPGSASGGPSGCEVLTLKASRQTWRRGLR